MVGGRQWRVLIVVRHPTFRETVRQVLSSDPRFVIVAETGRGDQAVIIVRQVELDLVLLDLHLPKIDSFSIAMAMKATQPLLTILMLSGDWSPAYERKAKAIGIQVRLAKQGFSLEALYRGLDYPGSKL